MKRSVQGAVLVFVLVLAAGAAGVAMWARGGSAGGAGDAGELRVAVSIPPLKGLVQPLLPAGTRVEIMIPPGTSEHAYEPTGDQLAMLARADLVVLVGMGLDARLKSFLDERPREGRRVVELAAVLAKQIAAIGVPEDHDEHEHAGEEHADHADHSDHGHGDGHGHGAGDPHVWLDPRLMMEVAEPLGAEVGAVLARRSKPGAAAPAGGAAALKEKLRAMDERYAKELADCPLRTIVVGHDAYGWMAKRYRLEVAALSGLNAGEPTADAVRAATNALQENRSRAVFVEPQLSSGAGKRLADALSVEVLVLDPLGDGDYFGLMERNLKALKRGLGCDAGQEKGGTP